ncbi:hypothetical protein ABH931_002217 [Streptacidiphilus sp. MAP12-33]|uniref:hypothetical protein n=1 Tax=Streptacidiphilus sp. MAP12-33 TaxID=3156266 RepID=UPI0035199B3C
MKNRLLVASIGGACTLGAAAVTLVPSFSLSSALAAPNPGALASATLVQLTNTQVDPINLTAYSGVYGTAQSTVVGEDDPGDFSDPDDMLSRITIATKNDRTSAQSAKYYAQSNLTGLQVDLNSKPLIRLGAAAGSVSSMDSYAECVPPPYGPYALAYNRTAGSVITVLGRQVQIGTSTLTVTGADMGVPTIGTSTLRVVVAPHEDPATQSRQFRASAWLDIDVSGTLNDTSGNEVYRGKITRLRLGEVHADCGENGPTPTPTPTGTATGTPTPTPTNSVNSGSPTPTESPTESPTPTPTPTPTGSKSPTPSPTPTGSGTTTSSPTPPTPTPSTSEGGGLADTGADGYTPLLALLGAALAATGAGVFRFGRRAGRHL